MVLLDEYRRRRSDLERRQQQLEEQVTRLEAQADRQKELAGLSRSVATFSQRVQQGLGHASFEQKRSLVELLIDRVIVTDGEVEIRYVMPTTQPSEQVRFCHLQLDYRARLLAGETVTGLGLGFGGFWTARRTLAGYEAMAMTQKRQCRNIDGSDIRAQAEFISGLFQLTA